MLTLSRASGVQVAAPGSAPGWDLGAPVDFCLLSSARLPLPRLQGCNSKEPRRVAGADLVQQGLAWLGGC